MTLQWDPLFFVPQQNFFVPLENAGRPSREELLDDDEALVMRAEQAAGIVGLGGRASASGGGVQVVFRGGRLLAPIVKERPQEAPLGRHVTRRWAHVVAVLAELVALSAKTGSENWDFERGAAISAKSWERAARLCVRVAQAVPTAPDPVPSPCGDGSIHLRWSRPELDLVVELLDDEIYWTRVDHGERSEGPCADDAALVSLVQKNFG